jgi:hypothetical protein
MAKRRVSERQSPEPVQQEASPLTLAQVIREALADLGTYASKDDVLAWIVARYPHLAPRNTTLVASLSMQRQQSCDGGEWARISAGNHPIREALERVKELAEKHGGIHKFAALLEQVTELAEEIGGLDNLRAAIAVLKTLSR